jgi:hypothetical protein
MGGGHTGPHLLLVNAEKNRPGDVAMLPAAGLPGVGHHARNGRRRVGFAAPDAHQHVRSERVQMDPNLSPFGGSTHSVPTNDGGTAMTEWQWVQDLERHLDYNDFLNENATGATIGQYAGLLRVWRRLLPAQAQWPWRQVRVRQRSG